MAGERRWVRLVGLLSILLPCRPVAAQTPECAGGTASITGLVGYPDRSDRAGATVDWLPRRCGQVIEDDSAFTLGGLVPGTYQLQVSVPGYCIPPLVVEVAPDEDLSIELGAIPLRLTGGARVPIAGGPELPPVYEEIHCAALQSAWASRSTDTAWPPLSDIPTGSEILDVVLSDTAAARLLQIGHHSPLALYFAYDTTTVPSARWGDAGVILTDFPVDAGPYLVVLRADATSLEAQVGTWGRDPEALRIQWRRGSRSTPWAEPVSRSTLSRIPRRGSTT